MNDVISRINQITLESAQTALDATFLAQRQSAALALSWVNTLEAAQPASRELLTQWVKQAQQVQQLWFDLAQESVRTGTEAFQTQARNVTEGVQTVNNAGRKAEAGSR